MMSGTAQPEARLSLCGVEDGHPVPTDSAILVSIWQEPGTRVDDSRGLVTEVGHIFDVGWRLRDRRHAPVRAADDLGDVLDVEIVLFLPRV
jgi:hypothetical protein